MEKIELNKAFYNSGFISYLARVLIEIQGRRTCRGKYRYWWLTEKEGLRYLHVSRFTSLFVGEGIPIPVNVNERNLYISIFKSHAFTERRTRREVRYNIRLGTFVKRWRFTKRLSWCTSPATDYFNCAITLSLCLSKHKSSVREVLTAVKWLYGSDWVKRIITEKDVFEKTYKRVTRQEHNEELIK